MSLPPISFADLRPGDDAADVQAAIARVVASGWYILGPEVEAFEREFAAASGAAHAVGVATGTDAITLLLRAAGIGPGDEVIVPAMTAAYTALAVVLAGAVPVFADVDAARLTMDPDACASAVTSRSRAIVAVHLYGQAADVPALQAVATRHGLTLIEDCCQAHLATLGGVPVGTTGIGGAFSFYPTKNLGALGDGGAITTGDATIAARVRRLRNGGQTRRYEHVEAGMNSRLDEIQAAVLRARLPRLGAATVRRRALAALYRASLPAWCRTIPEIDPGHVYHLFPIRTADRDGLRAHLAADGVETLVHYPIDLPSLPAFAPYTPKPCPEAARAARDLLSLPLYPTLPDHDVVRVAASVGTFAKGRIPA